MNITSKIKSFVGKSMPKEMGNKVLTNFNQGIAAGLCFGILFLIIIIVCFATITGCASGTPFAFLMIAAAAFAGGIIVGLVTTAFGDEKQMFSSLSAAINGAVGGFTVADLTKNESIIKRVMHSLAAAAGCQGIGLTSVVVIFFGAAGFVVMYFNKQYLLNPVLAKSQQTIEQDKKLQQLTKDLPLADFPFESSEDLSSKQEAQLTKKKEQLKTAADGFKEVFEDEELVRLLPVQTLRSYAKVCTVLEDYEHAEKILRKARSNAPDDADVIYQLADLLLLMERYDQATAFYSYLTHLPDVRVDTYKLLGYAGLFDFRSVKEAAAASRKYLCFEPDDAGAKLNLACALGQDGPNSANRAEVLELLTQAVHDWPEAGRRALALTADKEDFEAWKGDVEFMKIVSPAANAAATKNLAAKNPET